MATLWSDFIPTSKFTSWKSVVVLLCSGFPVLREAEGGEPAGGSRYVDYYFEVATLIYQNPSYMKVALKGKRFPRASCYSGGTLLVSRATFRAPWSQGADSLTNPWHLLCFSEELLARWEPVSCKCPSSHEHDYPHLDYLHCHQDGGLSSGWRIA